MVLRRCDIFKVTYVVKISTAYTEIPIDLTRK